MCRPGRETTEEEWPEGDAKVVETVAGHAMEEEAAEGLGDGGDEEEMAEHLRRGGGGEGKKKTKNKNGLDALPHWVQLTIDITDCYFLHLRGGQQKQTTGCAPALGTVDHRYNTSYHSIKQRRNSI